VILLQVKAVSMMYRHLLASQNFPKQLRVPHHLAVTHRLCWWGRKCYC